MILSNATKPIFALKDIFLCFFILCIILSDGLLIYTSSQAILSPGEIAFFFVGSRIFLAIVLTLFYQWGAINRPLILLALFTGVLGPFALVIGGVVFVYLVFFRLFSDRSHPGIILEEDKLHELCERLILGLEDLKDHKKTQPFAEILVSGQDEQKYQVLTKISRHYDPVFAPFLKKALDDASRMIKISAATILTSLDDGFTRKITELEKQISRYPQDMNAWAALAAEQYNYACSHLLDERRSTQLRRQSIDSNLSFLNLVQHATDMTPARKNQIWTARTHLGLAYLKEHEYRKAYAFLKPSEVPYPLSPNELIAELALVPFYCECLFVFKQYSLLKQIAVDLLAGIQKDPDLYPLDFQEALKAWAIGALPRPGIFTPQASVHEKDDEQDEINNPS